MPTPVTAPPRVIVFSWGTTRGMRPCGNPILDVENVSSTSLRRPGTVASAPRCVMMPRGEPATPVPSSRIAELDAEHGSDGCPHARAGGHRGPDAAPGPVVAAAGD